MRKFQALIVVVLFFSSCENKNSPDLSGIDLPVTVKRFEKDLFAMQSNASVSEIDVLYSNYPVFGDLFFSTILNADPNWSKDTLMLYTQSFLTAYRSIFDTCNLLYKDFSPYSNEIIDGLKRMKFYFSKDDSLPKQIITYIGPLNGYGDVMSPGVIAIGLHDHLGGNASYYQSSIVREVYPEYITRHFTPASIAVNAMKNIILDRYPESIDDLPLAAQMIEKGKRLYFLQKLLPQKAPEIVIGYTEKQWKECLDHEATIWQIFIQNNLLQSSNYAINKNYIGESPKTRELGDASPGNIGSFCGWKIVDAFMEKNPNTSLQQLMMMSTDEILQKAKYKP
jgi:hypothetical protein